MPVIPGLAITIAAGTPFFRITDVSFRTARTSLHKNVVDGQGARKSRHGAHYNHLGPTTVYLAENRETCFAERMFYLHREVLTAMNRFHLTGVLPPFVQTFVLWEIVFKTAIADVFDLQSRNVQSITPYRVEFRLVTADPPALPFTNHATEVLDFTAGEVKLTGTPLGIATYANWHRIEFHH